MVVGSLRHLIKEREKVSEHHSLVPRPPALHRRGGAGERPLHRRGRRWGRVPTYIGEGVLGKGLVGTSYTWSVKILILISQTYNRGS